MTGSVDLPLSQCSQNTPRIGLIYISRSVFASTPHMFGYALHALSDILKQVGKDAKQGGREIQDCHGVGLCGASTIWSADMLCSGREVRLADAEEEEEEEEEAVVTVDDSVQSTQLVRIVTRSSASRYSRHSYSPQQQRN